MEPCPGGNLKYKAFVTMGAYRVPMCGGEHTTQGVMYYSLRCVLTGPPLLLMVLCYPSMEHDVSLLFPQMNRQAVNGTTLRASCSGSTFNDVLFGIVFLLILVGCYYVGVAALVGAISWASPGFFVLPVLWFMFVVYLSFLWCAVYARTPLCAARDFLLATGETRVRRDASIEDGTSADSFWRKRGWLVMMRARERASFVVSRRTWFHMSLSALNFPRRRGVMRRPDRRVNNHSNMLFAGAAVSLEAKQLRRLVTAIVRIEEEGVFREIITCL